jgi:hypothetical protein
MAGDYWRYRAEFASGDDRKTKAEKAKDQYEAATRAAVDQGLPPTNPIRLGLALNYSAFACVCAVVAVAVGVARGGGGGWLCVGRECGGVGWAGASLAGAFPLVVCAAPRLTPPRPPTHPRTAQASSTTRS